MATARQERRARLYEQGLSSVAIAKQEGVTRVSVLDSLERAGVPRRENDPARIATRRWQGCSPRPLSDEPARFDMDALIARIEAQIADDATRGGSAFSR